MAGVCACDLHSLQRQEKLAHVFILVALQCRRSILIPFSVPREDLILATASVASAAVEPKGPPPSAAQRGVKYDRGL